MEGEREIGRQRERGGEGGGKKKRERERFGETEMEINNQRAGRERAIRSI